MFRRGENKHSFHIRVDSWLQKHDAESTSGVLRYVALAGKLPWLNDNKASYIDLWIQACRRNAYPNSPTRGVRRSEATEDDTGGVCYILSRGRNARLDMVTTP